MNWRIFMLTKKTPALEKPAPGKEAKPVSKEERLRAHRESAPPDVKAAYELVAEYERRCP